MNLNTQGKASSPDPGDTYQGGAEYRNEGKEQRQHV